MRWSALTNLPCFDAIERVRTNDLNSDYTSLFIYQPGISLMPNTVYFARAKDYLKETPDCPNTAFILLSKDRHATIEPAANQNVACFADKDTFDKAFDELQHEFAIERIIQKGIQQLIAMTANNDLLENMVEYISQIFGEPAVVIDTSFTHLATSTGFDDLNADFFDDILAGRVNPQIQNSLKETDVFHPMGVRRRTMAFNTNLVSNDGSPIFNNVTLVYIGDAIAGSLSLITTNSPLPRTRSEYLPTIASILSMEFQKNDFWFENKGAFFTHMLTELIVSDAGKPMDESDARLRFKVGGYDLRSCKYLIHYDMGNESFTLRETQTLALRAQEVLPNPVFFVNNGNIIFLVSADEFIECDDLQEIVRANVRSTALDSTSVKVGISSCFADISQIKLAYEQTLRTIAALRKANRALQIGSYDNLRLDDLLSHVSDAGDFEIYLYPPLIDVINEDQRKGTHLAHTLYCYLRNSEHVPEVCEELGIHKNTLYFRLARAKEIMHRDYKQGDVAMEIMLSFKILIYLGKFERLVLETERGKRFFDMLDDSEEPSSMS